MSPLPLKLLLAIFKHGDHVVPITERQSLETEIKNAFDKLDNQARLIITLYYKNNMSQSAIAQKENLSTTNVRKTLSRSLQQLRMAGNPAYANTVKRSFSPIK
ncbi:MAG: sigma-70 family RNA polymerase sigma factor [Chitinophagaceae bacterium]|nr:sigma-70 family RNA polymerase sigma factor [Chitinophagaceae bacterium]